MEAARCQLCGNPMSSWLEVCGDLCVCTNCAATVTLSDLAGAGFAKVKPDTYQMNGDSLVTKDSPDEILNYQEAKARFSSEYGKAVMEKLPHLVVDESAPKPLPEGYENNPLGAFVYDRMHNGDESEDIIGHGDLANTIELSWKWTVDDVVRYIKDLGFATESAFYAHCNALREGGYTDETSYALILESRYDEQTVADEAATHYNALEGQTPEEARALFIEDEIKFAKEHPELCDPGMDMSRLDPDKSYVD